MTKEKTSGGGRTHCIAHPGEICPLDLEAGVVRASGCPACPVHGHACVRAAWEGRQRNILHSGRSAASICVTQRDTHRATETHTHREIQAEAERQAERHTLALRALGARTRHQTAQYRRASPPAPMGESLCMMNATTSGQLKRRLSTDSIDEFYDASPVNL